MNVAAPASGLRDAHRDLTRNRILDGAIAAMRNRGFDAMTNVEVAAQAGVTERTLYRHFSSREALESAMWERVTAHNLGRSGFPKKPEDLMTLPTVLFEGFDREEALARWFVASPRGQAIRLSVNAERQKAYLSIVREKRPDLDAAAQKRLAGVIQLLDGSFAWQSLKDYWGLDGGEGGRAVSEAIAQLLCMSGAKEKEEKTS